MAKRRKAKRTVLRGIGASQGVAIGQARLLGTQEYEVPTRRVSPRGIGAEIRRFRDSLSRARAGIQALQSRLGDEAEDDAAQIMASQLMMLQDRELVREIVTAIKTERMNAPHAVRSVLRAKASYLQSSPSELFRARAADIRDLEHRLLGHLLGADASVLARLEPGSIVVASELTPSDTAALDPERVVAFVTEHGTLASHVTILARSRGVPAVIAVPEAPTRIPEGEEIIVDGERGIVVVGPTRPDRAQVEEVLSRARRIGRILDDREEHPGETLDGRSVAVEVNLDRSEVASVARRLGADGIGLFRTEFTFIGADGFPDEDHQVEIYRKLFEAFGERPVTIRTLDLGGDKYSTLMGVSREDNPFLGLRGIRYSLEHPEVFQVQIRAALRAADRGRLRLLLPMICSVDELRRAREEIERAVDALLSEGITLGEKPTVGVMIEVPSAVAISDMLAREADFFSIGSNDLTQYLLAVDRGNERIAHLYDSLNPAVLRAVDQTVRSAHAAGIPVGSCGEMSGDILGALLLVGSGVDALSVAPHLVRLIKEILLRVRASDLEALAAGCRDVAGRTELVERIRAGLRAYPEFTIEEQGGRLLCRWSPESAGEKREGAE